MSIARGQRTGRCRVCAHADVVRVERMMLGGASLAAIGRKFGLHKDALRRHAQSHMSPERRASILAGDLKLEELVTRAAEEQLALTDFVAIMASSLIAQYFNAVEASDRQSAALFSHRLAEYLRLRAQLSGQLREASSTIHNTLVVMQSPQVQGFLQELAQQLRPHPEALRSVVHWLEQREARTLEAVSQAPALEHRA